MARRPLNIKDLLPRLSAIFDLLDESERELVVKHATVQAYKKNEIIYSEGDIPNHLLCLVSGKVKVYKDGIGGRSQIVRVIRPVGFFGYRAAFASQNYVTGAAAFETSIIVKIPIGTITHVLTQNARLGWFFIEHLAVGLGQADERTVSLTQKHIRGRLAEALLFLKQSYGVEEDGFTLSIYLSREDLANLSNMTTSNAIRTLSNFANEKLIAIDGRKIKLIDEARLEKISRIG